MKGMLTLVANDGIVTFGIDIGEMSPYSSCQELWPIVMRAIGSRPWIYAFLHFADGRMLSYEQEASNCTFGCCG